MCTVAATGLNLALILLFGQQTVYQFVKLFSFFINGDKITNILDS